MYISYFLFGEKKAGDEGPWQSTPHLPFILSHLLRGFASSLLLLLQLPQPFSSKILSTHFLKRVSSGTFSSCFSGMWVLPRCCFVWFCIVCLPLGVGKWDLGIPICAFGRRGWDLVAKYIRNLEKAYRYGSQFTMFVTHSLKDFILHLTSIGFLRSTV